MADSPPESVPHLLDPGLRTVCISEVKVQFLSRQLQGCWRNLSPELKAEDLGAIDDVLQIFYK